MTAHSKYAPLLAVALTVFPMSKPSVADPIVPAAPGATVTTNVISALGISFDAVSKSGFANAPSLLSSFKPNWVYVGSGFLDAHVGKKQIFNYGKPTNQYTGVTLISPFEQSQYNPYPVGPEIGIGWKTSCSRGLWH